MSVIPEEQAGAAAIQAALDELNAARADAREDLLDHTRARYADPDEAERATAEQVGPRPEDADEYYHRAWQIERDRLALNASDAAAAATATARITELKIRHRDALDQAVRDRAESDARAARDAAAREAADTAERLAPAQGFAPDENILRRKFAEIPNESGDYHAWMTRCLEEARSETIASIARELRQ